MVRWTIIATLGLSIASCWSRDNPYDVTRCDPPCPAGQICFEAKCISAHDASTGDIGVGVDADANSVDGPPTSDLPRPDPDGQLKPDLLPDPDSGPLCGNGVINKDQNEQCEPGKGGNPPLLDGKDCQDLGFFKGALGCKLNCSFDTSGCSNCGNNQTDPGENCDGVTGGAASCVQAGYTAGLLGCKSDCTWDTSSCVKVQEPNGIAISTAGGDQLRPWVSHGAAGFAVVWEDQRASTGSTTTNDIYGARVTSAGTVSDPTGVAIRNTAAEETLPVIAFDGTNYLAAWSEVGTTAEEKDALGIFLDTSLQPANMTAPKLVISAAAGNQDVLGIAHGGGRYLVTWTDHRAGNPDPYAARVTTAAVVQDQSGIELTGNSKLQYGLRAAFDGTNFFTVWWDRRNTDWDIFGARISQSGTVLDSPLKQICTATGHQHRPDVAYGGGTYFVAWYDPRTYGDAARDIYGARVTTTATITDPQGIPIVTGNWSAERVAIAWGGAWFLVVWQDKRGGSWDIYGARVTTAGKVIDPNGFPISTAAGDQTYARVAHDGSTFLVVWEDHRDPASSGIYGARVK